MKVYDSFSVKKIYILLLGIFLGLSGAVFSVRQLPIQYCTNIDAVVTLFGSFVIFLFIFLNTHHLVWSFLLKYKLRIIGLTLVVILSTISASNVSVYHKNIFLFDSMSAYLFSSYFIVYFSIIFLCIYDKFHIYIQKIYIKQDRLASMTIYAILSIAMIVLYISQPKWYTQFDDVYSLDCNWFWNVISGMRGYYDIRHPLLGFIMFPVFNTLKMFFDILFPNDVSNLICVIILQCLNIKLLLVISQILRYLANSVAIKYLFLFSFSSILFYFAIEKYVIIAFFVVLYLLLRMENNKYALPVMLLCIGVMPTNIFLVFCDICFKDSVFRKLKNYIKPLFCGLAIIVCSGRVFCLRPSCLGDQIADMASFTTYKETYLQRMIATVNMITGVFVPLPSGRNIVGRFLWKSVTDSFSYIGIIILILILLGIKNNYRDMFYRVCMIWLLQSFVLFVILCWVPRESPLFSIIFSWSIVYLIYKGIEEMLRRIDNRYVSMMVYFSIIMFMLLTSTVNIYRINEYLNTL